jgi:hypothetical protein
MLFISNCTKISPFFLAKYTHICNYECESNENRRSMKEIEMQMYAAVCTAIHQHELQACAVYGRSSKYARRTKKH